MRRFGVLVMSLLVVGCADKIQLSTESDLSYEDFGYVKVEVKNFETGEVFYAGNFGEMELSELQELERKEKQRKLIIESWRSKESKIHQSTLKKSWTYRESKTDKLFCIYNPWSESEHYSCPELSSEEIKSFTEAFRKNDERKDRELKKYGLVNLTAMREEVEDSILEAEDKATKLCLKSRGVSSIFHPCAVRRINDEDVYLETLRSGLHSGDGKSEEIQRVMALKTNTILFGQRCRDYGYRFKEDIDSCVTKEAVTEQRLVEYEAKIARLERTIRENKIPTKEEKSDWDKFLQALVETGEELEKEEMKRDIESLKNQQRIERNRQNTKRAMDMLYRRPPTRY